MTNALLFLSGIVMLLIGGMFTVSTFDTHNWISLVLGVVFGFIGAIICFYEMGLNGNTVRGEQK